MIKLIHNKHMNKYNSEVIKYKLINSSLKEFINTNIDKIARYYNRFGPCRKYYI